MRIGNIELLPVTKNLLFINVIMFLAALIVGPKLHFDFDANFAAYYPNTPNFEPYQILTHMFMHANFAHILFNMFGLFMFGNVLESYIGGKRFLLLYFAAGFGALGFHYLSQYYQFYQLQEQLDIARATLPNLPNAMAFLNLDITDMEALLNQMNPETGKKAGHFTASLIFGRVVGASGAVYGLLAAYAYLFPNNKLVFIFIPYPVAAKYFVPAIIALDLFFGFNPNIGTGIAHFAHVGGAVIGFLMVIFWNRYNKKDFY